MYGCMGCGTGPNQVFGLWWFWIYFQFIALFLSDVEVVAEMIVDGKLTSDLPNAGSPT